jgi:hypothetical protein
MRWPAARRAEAHVEVAGAEAQEPQAEHAVHEDVVALAQGLDLRGGEVLAALAEQHALADAAGANSQYTKRSATKIENTQATSSTVEKNK